MTREDKERLKTGATLSFGVLAVIFVLVLGFVAPVSASPTTQLQTAHDNLANCQLLALHPNNPAQQTRAQQCVADQNRIIALLTATTPPPATTPPTSPSSTPTTQPSATPSPAPSNLNCAPNPSSCGFPDASNTGIPPGTVLTAAGTSTITTPNIVIDGKDMGCLVVEAANVTIRNSRISGQCFFVIRSNSVGLVVQDSEISCENSTGTGVAGKGFVVQRSEVTGCENGFSADNDVTVADSYIHGMYLANGGHTDGIQVFVGASNIGILHNTIFNENDGGTSAIISDDNSMTNINIQGNLMAGGSYTLYCPTRTSGAVTNNRISRIFKPNGGEFGPWIHCELANPRTGNVWDDSGAALPF
jgi:hypothetical protein